MAKRISVLQIDIDAVSMSEAVQTVEGFIAARSPHLVATANAEMVMMAQEDVELRQILNAAQLVVPDGAGVVWAASHAGTPVKERVAGYDLAQELLCESAQKGYKVYFFGSSPGVAATACDVACQRFPGLNVVGIRNGYFTADDEPEIIAGIKAAAPDILFAALGVPKQEKWLSAHLMELEVPVSIGVGGTFDVMAGKMLRAPLWMQRAKLEWLFRLLLQPKRILRIAALPKFVIRVLSGKNN